MSNDKFQIRMKSKISLFTICLVLFTSQALIAEDFQALREDMVEKQLVAKGIKDKRVLAAMRKVERHRFAPSFFRQASYRDVPIQVGENQTMSPPYAVAFMAELLGLKGSEKVLELGTGSGYQAAILAELAKEVYTIEIRQMLANKAEVLLQELGYKNIRVKCGDGFLGWTEYAPFDAILVTFVPKEMPETLIAQLAEGGCLVVPILKTLREFKILKKVKGKIEEKIIIPDKYAGRVRNK